jgi:hypothetical protein
VNFSVSLTFSAEDFFFNSNLVLLVPYPDTLFFSFFVKYKYCWKFDGNLQYFSRLLFRWTCKIPKRGGTVCVNYVSVPFFF